MTENKLKLMVKLITVAAIVLLSVMLIILTVQFVSLAKLRREKASLDKSVAYVTEYTADVESQIDYFSNTQAVEDMYRAQGYNKDTDVVFGK